MRNPMKIILFFLVLVSAVSQNLVGNELEIANRTYFVPYTFEIVITNSEFQYINLYEERGESNRTPGEMPSSSSGSYTVKYREGYTILCVSFPENPRELIVFYHGTQLVVFDPLIDGFIWAQEINTDGYGLFYPRPAGASSYLTERINNQSVSYGPENLRNRDLTLPWVEGNSGNGIGETISFTSLQASHLILLNGFFSPSHLSLYSENNRIKSLMVRGFDQEDNLLYETEKDIDDLPNFQFVDLPEISYTVTLEILDVYPGTIYDDTCLAGVYKDGLQTDYDWGRR